MTAASINPATGATLETFAETTPAALERILDQALAAYQSWRRCSYAQRAKPMREAGRPRGNAKPAPHATRHPRRGNPLNKGKRRRRKAAGGADTTAKTAEGFSAAHHAEQMPP